MHAEPLGWAAVTIAVLQPEESAGELTWGEEVPIIDLGLR